MVKDKDYDYKPEYYVFNANFNKKGEIEKYNIFNNVTVYKYTCALLDKYYAGRISFDDFAEELRKTVAWQEMGRVEYETVIKDMFYKDSEKKIDCYQQFALNYKAAAREIIAQNRKYSKRYKKAQEKKEKAAAKGQEKEADKEAKKH